MNEMVLIISCFIILLYLMLMLFLTIGIGNLKVFNPSETNCQNSFSIIVPFRNEQIHLKALLNSFKNLNYPLENFEIILVNDTSTDNSFQIVQQFMELYPTIQIRLIQHNIQTISPKKTALENALKVSQYEWIITIDADCIVPKNWLKTYDNFIQSSNCDMVVAPVIFTSDRTFFQDFQQLDFLSLMGATQGGFGFGFPFLCNGANLCYRKAVFIEVHGFEGNKNIASGDDIFLMEKFLKRNKSSVKYLKNRDVIVQTQPQNTLRGFINQRIRWAAKTVAYENKAGKLVGIIVLSMNLWLFLSFLLLSLKWISFPKIFLIWMLKMGVDYLLLFVISQFYHTKISIAKYFLFSFIYPFYTVIVGVLSFGKGYEWKGRRFLR
ncbi:MAG: glycosyltransferase [Flavobacteriaceae bacterium]|nr:glycosyltransferase [Flavobacteriaceae bacterium]